MGTSKPVGIIGAGSFGTALANLLACNTDVLIYTRNADQAAAINQEGRHLDLSLSPRIRATLSLEEIANTCDLIFPVVPSVNFRDMMQQLGPFLRPYHMLIHGTKGFDISDPEGSDDTESPLTRHRVHTMSEVIQQESVVVKVGCLSGPNLATEILQGLPTATVIGSRFKEVIDAGKKVLGSKNFHVFGTFDILGAELAGALKNIIALGSGILKGKGLGKNIEAMLITRGLMEMINFGKAMGADSSAFFGTAGIGDLIATATSEQSRNYTFGLRLGSGESTAQIQETMPELAEGVRTLRIAKSLARYYKLKVPITDSLYHIVFENYDINRVLDYLMVYPYDVDVDFL